MRIFPNTRWGQLVFVVVFAVALGAATPHVHPFAAERVLAADLEPAAPSEVGFSAERLERLEAGMHQMVNDGKLAGVITMLARHGKVVHQVDGQRLIRLDDLELRDDVQNAVAGLWDQAHSENLNEISDFLGFRKEFSGLFGFQVEGVDYDEPVELDVRL